jgi:hypothetical protein
MRQRNFLRGALIVVALGLAILGRAQDNPFGDVDDKTLVDDTKQAKPRGDDPFAAPADTLRQLKKVERTVNELAGHAGTSLSDKPRQVHTSDQVREALGTLTRMEFTEMPLIDAVDYLKDHHGIEIQLDHRALEAAGVGTDTPVTRVLNGLPLDASLKLLLGEYDLTYLVHDGVLLITTEGAARDYLELKVYVVSKSNGADVNPAEVGETLALLRQSTLANTRQGPPAPDNFTVVPFQNLLIIRAPQHDHEEIEKLFAEIKSKLAANE